MMQIKVFDGNDQDDINEWIRHNDDIKVTSITRRDVIVYFENRPNTIASQYVETVLFYEGV